MDQSSLVYRYIDLPQLISLLLNKSLFFPRLTCLSDKNEFIGNNLIKPIIYISERARQDEIYRNALLAKEPKLKNKLNKIRKELYESCWSTERDNYALWKIYTNNSKYGFCIESTIGDVMESLALIGKCKLYNDSIDYSYNSIRNIRMIEEIIQHIKTDEILRLLAFMKIDAYKYEQEYRFIIHYNGLVDNNGLSVKCDLAKLIYRIHLSLFMPEWFKKTIEDLSEILLKGDLLKRTEVLSQLLHFIKTADTSVIRE